ncbi:hypothetical protein PR048_029438 [Dryococelus australis]|uniref:Uncharacterized protein n=1 Tax=Dryococelus australis TaxID=614101 RepID=A0ABQ9GFQ6_9NEOP|nr:hypothetical protein PR048_029438 [Dryococelus australis]
MKESDWSLSSVYRNTMQQLEIICYVLNPESSQSIAEIARVLPGGINVDLLLDECRLLRSEKDKKIPGQRIDHVWRNIYQLKNSVGAAKYHIVEGVVKMSLSISHGSADVERGFFPFFENSY